LTRYSADLELDVIHGDIKPSNILVFSNTQASYTAKVADFGYSTWFRREDNLLLMPRSAPWNAPEHHGQKLQLLDAKRMDVYSFGMLCLWLLFGVETPEIVPLPPDTTLVDPQTICFELQTTAPEDNLLLVWKYSQNDRLLDWATWLVAEHGHFTKEIQDGLIEFFRSSLRFDPEKRSTDVSYLLSLLAQKR